MAFKFTPLPYKYDTYYINGTAFNKKNNEKLILLVQPQNNKSYQSEYISCEYGKTHFLGQNDFGYNGLYVPISLFNHFGIISNKYFNSKTSVILFPELFMEFNYLCKQSQIMRWNPLYIAMNIVYYENYIVRTCPGYYNLILNHDKFDAEFTEYFSFSDLQLCQMTKDEPKKQAVKAQIDQICAYLILKLLNYRPYSVNTLTEYNTVMNEVKAPVDKYLKLIQSDEDSRDMKIVFE
jgi:hypothetical protein